MAVIKTKYFLIPDLEMLSILNKSLTLDCKSNNEWIDNLINKWGFKKYLYF